jgi:hypothetical protein
MSYIILSAGIIGASGFDEDAINFLNAAGIEDTTQRYAINTAVRDLKNANIWGKLDAAYPIVGSTATTQKYNLRNPQDTDGAHRLEFYGGITHSSNGFAGNGSNAYADTNYSTNLLNTGNSHICFYQRFNFTPSGGGDIDMGAFNEGTPGDGTFLAAQVVSGLTRGRMFRNAADYSQSDPRGFFMITDNADTRLFRNGVKLTTIANSGTTSAGNIFLSAMNRIALPGAGYYTPGNYAWASIGDGLTDTQASDYYTIVQAYQTTLGRQV